MRIYVEEVKKNGERNEYFRNCQKFIGNPNWTHKCPALRMYFNVGTGITTKRREDGAFLRLGEWKTSATKKIRYTAIEDWKEKEQNLWVLVTPNNRVYGEEQIISFMGEVATRRHINFKRTGRVRDAGVGGETEFHLTGNPDEIQKFIKEVNYFQNNEEV